MNAIAMRALEAALEAVTDPVAGPGDEPVEADALLVAETPVEDVFVLEAGGGPYEVRVLGIAAELLGVDHEALVRTARIAGAVGSGPEVIAWLPVHRCLVTRSPGTAGPPDTGARRFLAGLAGSLGALHAAPGGGNGGDSVFRLAERHRKLAADHDAAMPPEAPIAAAVVTRIERAFGAGAPRALREAPCHRHPAPGSIVAEGERILLTGFAFAGTDDRLFDLACFAETHDLDDEGCETLLEFSLGGAVTSADRVAFRLLRMTADYLEGMRELVLSTAGDEGAAQRAQDRLRRCLAAATDDRFEQWLRGVARRDDESPAA